MTDLSDLFAFLYMIDLRSLRAAVEEAARILAEREHQVSPSSATSRTLTARRTGGG
jgi:hypothetical protein